MQIASGTYTGNGTAQDVNAGFAADLVVIKGTTLIAQVWTSTMGATTCKPMTGATAVDTSTGVTQHASGFTVAANAAINTNAVTYYYLAIKDNAIADFQVGSYTGDGNDGRSLALLDFDPNAVWIMSAGADAAVQRMSSYSGDLSSTFSAGTATNIIQSFITNGWTVGTNTAVNNVDARTYYYVAWKNSTLFKVIDDGSSRAYLGDGLDDRTITGAGFQPDAGAFIKSSAGATAYMRLKGHSGDQSALLDNGSAVLTDRIQAFEADGFQLGTNSGVNLNATAFHAMVFKEGTTSAAAASSSLIRLTLMGVAH